MHWRSRGGGTAARLLSAPEVISSAHSARGAHLQSAEARVGSDRRVPRPRRRLARNGRDLENYRVFAGRGHA